MRGNHGRKSRSANGVPGWPRCRGDREKNALSMRETYFWTLPKDKTNDHEAREVKKNWIDARVRSTMAATDSPRVGRPWFDLCSALRP